jgi:GNAT superfamily N-acetyltransferase
LIKAGFPEDQAFANAYIWQARAEAGISRWNAENPTEPMSMSDWLALYPLTVIATGARSLTESTLNQFVGVNAVTADRSAAAKAYQRVMKGEDPETVRRETGWFMWVDGRWRCEIDDSKARFRGFNESTQEPEVTSTNTDAFMDWIEEAAGRERGIPLPQALDHPALFEAYPRLKTVRLKVDPSRKEGGMFTEIPSERLWQITIGDPYSYNSALGTALDTVLHEVQHVIQSYEDFARGGNLHVENLPSGVLIASRINAEFSARKDALKASPEYQALLAETIANLPESAFISARTGIRREEAGRQAAESLIYESSGLDALEIERLARVDRVLSHTDYRGKDSTFAGYRHLAGEAEARNTVLRKGMSAQERLATAPTQTLDISEADAILLRGDGRIAADMGRIVPAELDSTNRPLVAAGESIEDFLNFFGPSQARDAKGLPLRVHHGSPHSDIEDFQSGHTAYGIFFTPDSDTAAYYARGKDARIYDAYLRIDRLADFDDPVVFDEVAREAVDFKETRVDEDALRFADRLYREGYEKNPVVKAWFDEIEGVELIGDGYSAYDLLVEDRKDASDIEDLVAEIDSDVVTEAFNKACPLRSEELQWAAEAYGSQNFYLYYQNDFMRAAQVLGYDGVVFTDPSSTGQSVSYVVFEASQVRLAPKADPVPAMNIQLQVGVIGEAQWLGRLAAFQRLSDAQQFERYEARETVIDALVAQKMADSAFTGMILPVAHGHLSVTASAKAAGAWQVTYFDVAMQPLSDSGIQGKEEALREFFVECRADLAPELNQFMAESFEWFGVVPEAAASALSQWQRASKVVDAQGVPVRVYHATDKPFSEVDMSKGAQGVFWVTSDREAIERGEVGASGTGTVLEMYVRIENPAGWDEYERLSIGELIAAGYDGVVLPDGDHFDAIVFEADQVRFAEPVSAKLERAKTLNQSPAFVAPLASSKVRDAHGDLLKVYHGTTETVFVSGNFVPGNASAVDELIELAQAHGIADWTSVAPIFERWAAGNGGPKGAVTMDMALAARALYERSKPQTEPGKSVLGFTEFQMPSGTKELGAHFGLETQAKLFGDVFEFYLNIENPLRLPDLGNWDYQLVMQHARRAGVEISEAEYTAVFEAPDNNAALRELLLSKGVDGVVYFNEAEGWGDSYIAFKPDQIFSAADLDLAAERGARVLAQSALQMPARTLDQSPALVDGIRVDNKRGNLPPGIDTSEAAGIVVRQTETESFKKFFRDSPVVAGGKPRRMYHGSKTPDQLTTFIPGGPEGARQTGDLYGLGCYFTSDTGEASRYAGPDGAVIPVFLAGNILDLDAPVLSEADSRALSDFANRVLLPSDMARFPAGRKRAEFATAQEASEFFKEKRLEWTQRGDGMDRAFPEVVDFPDRFFVHYTDFDAQVEITSGPDAYTLFKAIGWDNVPLAGFDGVMIDRGTGDGRTWVVMHNPEGNVKSAIGNNGAFNNLSARILDQTAFTGSPATDIEAFDLSKSGSAGGNSYGYGVYLSESEQMADFYRQTLSRLKGWSPEASERVARAFAKRYPASLEMEDITVNDLLGKNSGYLLSRMIDDWAEPEFVTWANDQGGEGRVYAVTIPDNDELLIWDAVVSDQPEAIREILYARSLHTVPLQPSLQLSGVVERTGEPNGSDIYLYLCEVLKSDAKASAMLSDLGIKGLTYKQMSFGTKDFVIFKPEDAQIIKDSRADKAFRQFFRASQATVDGRPGSEPLRVFTGTAADFDAFSLEYVGSANDHGYAGRGFYFMDDPEWASGYAEVAAEKGGSPVVMPVYLSMQNPLVISRYEDLPGYVEGGPYVGEGAFERGEEMRQRLIDLGYDGVITKGKPGNPSEYMVFHPNQIKSAIGNNGNWSLESDRILDQSAAVAFAESAAAFAESAEDFAEVDDDRLIRSVPAHYMADWKRATGLPEEVVARYWELSSNQRGAPEAAMLRAQEALGGGVLSQAIEHVGDLTDRLGPRHSFGFAYEETKDKAERYLSSLRSGYGFSREHLENLEKNARFSGTPIEEFTATANAALDAYADAHAALVTYTPVQTLARDAAVALGRRDFDRAAQLLEEMLGLMKTRELFVQDMQTYGMPEAAKAVDVNPADSLFRQDKLKVEARTAHMGRDQLISFPLDQYLMMTAELDNPLSANSERKISEVTQAIKSGIPLTDIPYLKAKISEADPRVAKVYAQEGRHRAIALQRLGYTHMPVRFASGIRWSEQNKPGTYEYAKVWPTILEGEDSGIQLPFPISREMAGQHYTFNNQPAFDPTLPLSERPAFRAWFAGSHAVDNQGNPIVVYRGEHGEGDDQLQTMLGTYTFTEDAEVANQYAVDPNDSSMTPLAPKVIPAYLSIQNPILVNYNDPFIDIHVLVDKLGRETAEKFTRKHGDWIRNTDNWHENYSQKYRSVNELLDAEPDALGKLYLDAYPLLDDAEFIQAAKDAGFDGAIHIGNGASAASLEYRVFSPEQIKSAIGNNGNYDRRSPNILNQSASTASQPAQIGAPRGVLRVDEHGKKIVWERGDYSIAVDSLQDVGYVSLWHEGKRVGAMSLGRGRTSGTRDYKTVSAVEVDKGHRGRGLGKQLYRVALEFVGEQYRGIGGEHEQRSNSRQVPAIYRALGGRELESGDLIIDRAVSGLDLEVTRRDQNFRQWFDGSLVVDASGMPLVVYHGTDKDIVEFNTTGGSGKTSGTGAFFSSSPATAATYSGVHDGNILPVYLSLRKPAVFDAGGANWNRIDKKARVSLPEIVVADDDAQLLADLEGVEPEKNATKKLKARSTTLGKIFPDEFLWDDYFSTDDLSAWARKQGYDGVIIKNVRDRGPSGALATEQAQEAGTLYVAFDPAQIKSAIGNNGNYDRRSPNILNQSAARSRQPLVERPAFKSWFNGSQVVDAEGMPLVLYHGTDTDNRGVFLDMQYGRNNVGTHFGTVAAANELLDSPTRGFTGAKHVYPVYLNIQNPLRFDISYDRGTHMPSDLYQMIMRKAEEEGIDGITESDIEDYYNDEHSFDGRLFTDDVNTQEHAELIKDWIVNKLGYDGIQYVNGGEDAGSVSWIALFPEQIKSAIGNDGSFDRRSRNILEQMAWHGTPHDYERIDLSRAGSSEGAAAFGWGMYFAGKREVAAHYTSVFGVGGSPVPQFFEVDGVRTSSGTPLQKAADLVHGLGLAKARKMAREWHAEAIAGDEWTQPNGVEFYASIVKIVEALKSAKSVQRAPGFLLNAEIPDDDVLLDWQSPFSAQPKAVQDAMTLISAAMPLDVTLAPGVTGEAWYKSLARFAGSQRQASHLLAANGVPGITYLERSLSKNFVIFDENLIRQLSKEQLRTLDQFAGRKAATADMTALKKARKMFKAGEPEPVIWKETGWRLGVDGQWRFELDDSAAALRQGAVASLLSSAEPMDVESFLYSVAADGSLSLELRAKGATKGVLIRCSEATAFTLLPAGVLEQISSRTGAPVEMVVSEQGDVASGFLLNESFRFNGFNMLPLCEVLDHPALFAAYPQLGRSNDVCLVGLQDGMSCSTSMGQQILIGREHSPEGMLRFLLHEVQHVIQEIEGFGRGGSPDMAFADPRMNPRATRAGNRAAREMLVEMVEKLAEPSSLEDYARNAWGVDADGVTEEVLDAYADYVKGLKESFDSGRAGRLAQDTVAREWYRRLAGEIESRVVERRWRLTAEQRREQPVSGDEDIPTDKAIVLRYSASALCVDQHAEAAGRLGSMVDQYLRTETGLSPWFKQSVVDSANWGKGECEKISADLVSWLKWQGVDARLVFAQGLSRGLDAGAASDWTDFTDRGGDTSHFWHAAVFADGLVIDLSGSQFGGRYSGVRLLAPEDFHDEWEVVRLSRGGGRGVDLRNVSKRYMDKEFVASGTAALHLALDGMAISERVGRSDPRSVAACAVGDLVATGLPVEFALRELLAEAQEKGATTLSSALRSLGSKDFDFTASRLYRPQGRLLDWAQPISEQACVTPAVTALAEGLANWKPAVFELALNRGVLTGSGLFEGLVRQAQAEQGLHLGAAVSHAGKLLTSAGITGVSVVLGAERLSLPFDGDNDRLFDALKNFREEPPRAQIAIGQNLTFDIRLLTMADSSSFGHEVGHAFLEILRDQARRTKAPDSQIRRDWAAVSQWLKLDKLRPDEAIPTQAHERFARGFELYLRRGDAPSVELEGVFELLASLLRQIYEAIKDLFVTVPAEINVVYDRMLATDEQLARKQPAAVDPEPVVEVVELIDGEPK